MKVSVILNSDATLKNGEHPLTLRIAHKEKRKYVSLNVSLPKSKWNKDKGQLKGVKARDKDHPKYKEYEEYLNLKSLIADKMQVYNNEIKFLASQGRIVTIDQLIQRVENPVKETTLFGYFEITVIKFRNANKLKTADVYKMTLDSIKSYTGSKDQMFTDINLSFLNNYEDWLKQKGLKETSISIYFRTLRALLNKAIGEGYMKQTDYPFGKKNENTKFNISKFNDKTEKRAITEAELKAIEDVELEPHLELAREYFLCSYYLAGINFNDLCKLTWNNLKDGRISYTRAKTNAEITTIVLSYPQKVIDKYKLITGIDERNYILPVLNRHTHKSSTQIKDRIHKVLGQINKGLKQIAKEVGIKENLTTYVARHSFITHMANSGKVTPFELKNMVGHSDLKTTMVYYKDVEQKKQDELMKKVFNSAG